MTLIDPESPEFQALEQANANARRYLGRSRGWTPATWGATNSCAFCSHEIVELEGFVLPGSPSQPAKYAHKRCVEAFSDVRQEPEHRCLCFHRGLGTFDWACKCGWWHAWPCPDHNLDTSRRNLIKVEPGPKKEHGLWSK